jgi:uncharacterized protein YbaR (Trm112 family)
MLDKKLLEVLVCTACKSELFYDKENNKLICKKCRLKFPILEGDIPDMLLEHAEKF